MDAEVTMEPDFRNRLRWQRNRSELLPPAQTNANGYYEYTNVPEAVSYTHLTLPTILRV